VSAIKYQILEQPEGREILQISQSISIIQMCNLRIIQMLQQH